MIFSSVFFIFIFLPIVLLLYFLVPKILKNPVILIASLIFYAWGEPVYILLMIFSILFNYLTGLEIDDCRSKGLDKKARTAFWLAVGVNLGILGFFKYFGFFIDNLNAVLPFDISYHPLALPIGISFYTFQTLSYIIDVYKGKVKVQKNIIYFGTYISMFPQLIAGPIVRYSDIEGQLKDRKVNLALFGNGTAWFLRGLAKKVLLANNIGMAFDAITALPPGELSVLTAWIGCAAYTFQIYFDFSGYSDMAIGLGKMFGFTFLENFNYPYISSSIQEFWRRWHISLSTWFKEYLYIPLGGNRKGEARTMLNKLIVFICTGIWHGANWTFLVWGLFHGLFITLEYKKLIPLKNKIFAHIYTMLVVICGFVIFRADTMKQACHILKSMFTGFTVEASEWMLLAKMATPYTLCSLVAGIILCAPVSGVVKNRGVIKYVVAAGLIFVCIMNLATSSYNPFIYFRF